MDKKEAHKILKEASDEEIAKAMEAIGADKEIPAKEEIIELREEIEELKATIRDITGAEEVQENLSDLENYLEALPKQFSFDQLNKGFELLKELNKKFSVLEKQEKIVCPRCGYNGTGHIENCDLIKVKKDKKCDQCDAFTFTGHKEGHDRSHIYDVSRKYKEKIENIGKKLEDLSGGNFNFNKNKTELKGESFEQIKEKKTEEEKISELKENLEKENLSYNNFKLLDKIVRGQVDSILSLAGKKKEINFNEENINSVERVFLGLKSEQLKQQIEKAKKDIENFFHINNLDDIKDKIIEHYNKFYEEKPIMKIVGEFGNGLKFATKLEEFGSMKERMEKLANVIITKIDMEIDDNYAKANKKISDEQIKNIIKEKISESIMVENSKDFFVEKIFPKALQEYQKKLLNEQINIIGSESQQILEVAQIEKMAKSKSKEEVEFVLPTPLQAVGYKLEIVNKLLVVYLEK